MQEKQRMIMPLLLLNGPSAISLFLSGLLQLLLVLSVAYKLIGLKWRIHSQQNINVYVVGFLFFFMSFISFALFQEDSFFYIRCFLIWALSLVIAQVMVGEYKESIMVIFSNVMLVFTLLGILGLLIHSFSLGFEVIKSIPPRDYHTNFLTVWITDSGYNSSLSTISPFSIRLQSFFDEPGTFGVLLPPVFSYFLLKKRFVCAFIISLGLFFSESLNAIVMTFVFLSFIVFWRGSFLSKLFTVFFAIVLILFAYEFLRPIIEIKLGLDPAYGTNSSLSVRQAEYELMLSSVNSLFSVKPFSAVSDMAISSSYVRWFFSCGILFVLAFISIVIDLFLQWRIVQFFKHARCETIPIFLLSFSLFVSGFQRASILDNILFMTLFFSSSLLLRFISENIRSSKYDSKG